MPMATTADRHGAGAGPAGLRLPEILLGVVGLGGFVDGILLHRILRWHRMTVPAAR